MIYSIIFVCLLVMELAYFQLADRYNIIDKPNLRSSHTDITLRGGGLVFYFAVLAYFLVSGFQYPWFFLGLSFMTIISFLDDVFTLSNKLRLLIHFTSVFLLAYELQIFEMPWYVLLITFVIIVGVINAYNFMDGINGITAAYSLAVGSLLLLTNLEIKFVDQDLLTYTILGVLVFSIFNFRKKAKCFAGDVGSVAIAYILLFALGALILKTGNVIYILFLGVYGIDAVWTIIRRMYLGENIFEGHRSHLYQYLANEAKINKLVVSSAYGVLQLIIGLLVMHFSKFSASVQLWFAFSVLAILSGLYLVYKSYVIKKYTILISKN